LQPERVGCGHEEVRALEAIGRSRGSGVKYGNETMCIGRVEVLDMSGSWGRMDSSAASGASYASSSSFVSSSSPLVNAVDVSRLVRRAGAQIDEILCGFEIKLRE
jgi:hypothetical protein